MFPAMSEVADPLNLLLRLRYPAAASAEALLQRDPKAAVAIALAQLIDHQARSGAIGQGPQPLPVPARIEQIVHVEGDRRVWPRTILDESRAVGASVEVRVELVSSIKGEALIVGHGKAVGPLSG